MVTKTKVKTSQVDTWLPVFPGFYETIWEASDGDMECELHYINEQRAEKGLPALGDDNEIEWDYQGYAQEVSEGVTEYIGDRLIEMGMIAKYTFQKLSSPREYNFYNDHIDVAFTLSVANKQNVRRYLQTHKDSFAKYLEGHYTSYDGFISHHSNNVDVWLVELEATLTHEHRLGAVLNFILLNDNPEIEMNAYEEVSGNMSPITASNYTALIGGK